MNKLIFFYTATMNNKNKFKLFLLKKVLLYIPIMNTQKKTTVCQGCNKEFKRIKMHKCKAKNIV